ncbi:MAG TPA: hypothetical protein P5102_11405 [Candidatus Competibacteraceae bacterium]|nr:hypothetical protein [Candidatus Competibacteraceae bacterium]HRZ06735.1 hypothetical protein [Candidatus Competibacteraceae bacterium]HSA44969.1 hypothetical protein [Candidatus Competibacteraceae bacterium]
MLGELVDEADRAVFIEQERQLLYVACTRAREQLLVTYSGKPSRFFFHNQDQAEKVKIVDYR